MKVQYYIYTLVMRSISSGEFFKNMLQLQLMRFVVYFEKQLE